MIDPVRSLARWCSLTVLAEPSLVRSLRLRLARDLDASAEADLWWSSFVESRTTRGIVFETAAAAKFRDELRELHRGGDPRPALAWALVQEHHRSITPAVWLEEEIAWLWVSLPNPGSEIEKRLRTALAAVVNEGRTALAPWAGRAIPRLPEIARDQPSAWYLEQEAHAQLPHLSSLGTLPPEEVDLAVLARMSGRMRRAALGTLRVGDRLYLGAVGPSGRSIEVPATDPRVVEVIRSAGVSAVQIRAGGLQRIDVGWDPISIRTRLGIVYDLPVWDGLNRDRLESSVVNLFDGHTRSARLGVVVGDGLVAAMTAEADAPPEVEPLNGSQRLASVEVRRLGELTLLRVDHLTVQGYLPVRRLRRPPERGRRWYGQPQIAGLVREPVFSDIPGSPIQMQARHPSNSIDPVVAQGGPIVVDGEISGLVTSLVPVADFGGDGDLVYGNWSDLWALLYPEAAAAPAQQWLTALADIVQSLCLELHTRFRPLGGVEPENEQFADRQRIELLNLAESTVGQAIRELLDAAIIHSDPVLFSAQAQDLLDLDVNAIAELTTADPRDPASPLDPAIADVVLSGLARVRREGGRAAREGNEDLLARVESLVAPSWRAARDRLADLRTPGFSHPQDFVGFLSALLRSYRRMFVSLPEQYGVRLYRTEHSVPQDSLAILSPLRLFKVDQISSATEEKRLLEGRFAELITVFEWATTELVDAVAAFDLQAKQDGYQYDLYLSYSRSGTVGEWFRRDLLPALQSALGDELGRVPRIFSDTMLEPGANWQDSLTEALRRSKMMVAVLAPSYFSSAWCATEWNTMQARERLLGDEWGPLIYPVVASRADRLPESASSRQSIDLSRWVNLPSEFKDSPSYLEFYSAVKRLAETIAGNLDRVPVWRPDFPTASAADQGIPEAQMDTLATRASLAAASGQAGDPAAARDQYAALLPDMERVHGPEHPDTLATGASLAHWTGLVGDAASARDQYAALLPLYERVLGAEHPETLTARTDLAYWTGEAGDPAGARDQLAALLPVRERVSGPEHPDTLTARADLAYFTGAAGDPAAARDQLAALLPVRERVSGPEHPDTLITRANLARFTGAAGDPAGARDQFAALLPVRERILGAEHPDTLITRANLAYFTGAAGDPARARDQYTALLPIRERVSGPEHPKTLSARGNLAHFTGAAGDAAGARDQYAALLPVRERVLGPDHNDTRAARANVAYWTREADGDAGTALK